MRHNRVHWIVALGLVAALTSSCDSPARSGPSGGVDLGSSSGGPATSRDGPGEGVPAGSGNGSSDDGFAWVPFGPADPASPVPGDWPQYNSLAQRRCGDLMRSENGATDDQLWRALDALCAAVVDGDEEQWDVARTAYDNADGKHFADPCLEDATRALLERALAWREAHPRGRPEVHFPLAAAKTDCGSAAKQDDDQGGEENGEEDGEEPSDPGSSASTQPDDSSAPSSTSDSG